MNKKALIFGVSGQDGSYLADLLLGKGYYVIGTSRSYKNANNDNLSKLKIRDQVNLVDLDPINFDDTYKLITSTLPDEIYYLAGQSSVGKSFIQPFDTINSFLVGSLNVLESCRLADKDIKIYNAGSSECFGNTDTSAANESFRFKPESPYGVAKASAHWLVNNYREAYGMYSCTGILFNHESILRPENFVTQKIIRTAKRIKQGSNEQLILGKMDIVRDWGWAPEYVEAMWLMLQENEPSDFIIATGHSISLEDFVRHSFDCLDLDYKDFIKQDQGLLRPTDIHISKADPSKAKRELNWEAKTHTKELIKIMIETSL